MSSSSANKLVPKKPPVAFIYPSFVPGIRPSLLKYIPVPAVPIEAKVFTPALYVLWLASDDAIKPAIGLSILGFDNCNPTCFARKDIPLGVIKNLEILETSVIFLSAWVTAPPLIRPPVTVSMIGGASPVRLNKGPFIRGVSSVEGQSIGFAPLRSKFPPAKFDFKSFNPIN